MGICVFLRWGENLCLTSFVSRLALVFVKRNNLITIALVLALNVLLVRFSGVKMTFVSEVIMKIHKLVSPREGKSVFAQLGLATLDFSSLWIERTSCPKVMTESRVLQKIRKNFFLVSSMSVY